jgi:hypothetical protein
MSWRVAVVLLLVAWGVLAFGAVYPWAFIPLFVACVAVGGLAFFQRTCTSNIELVLGAALALLIAAIALQLVPLSADTIGRVSPSSDALLRRYVIGYPESSPTHPLSIRPRSTELALAVTLALGVLLLGLSGVLTRDDAKHAARGIAVLGVIVAIAGIAQNAMWNGKIYGIWSPQEPGNSFGPFVNRNHFAGWMLMALPLVGGYLFARISRGMQHTKSDWRSRLLWLSSADASETIWIGFAVMLMALALTMTMSRSGILGLFGALILSAWFVIRRQSSGSRRVIASVYLILVALVAVEWTGLDRLSVRFHRTDVSGFDGRWGVWADTWRVAERFPLVGTGVNTYGAATLFYQTSDLQEHYSEAHNDYLQVAAEGGLLVVVPAVLVLLILVSMLRRRFREVSEDTSDYWVRIGAVLGIVAIAVQEMTDFSLQMPGNAVMFVLLLALAIRRPSVRTRPSRVSAPA